MKWYDKGRLVYSFIVSNIDVVTDIIVLKGWIISKNWVFVVLSSISLLLTSIFSVLSAFANKREYLAIIYFFHIGVWIEFFDSLFVSKRVLSSFKKLKFAEVLYEALPQGTIQFYFAITQKSDIFTILSAFQKSLSVGWTFSNQIKDTICNNQLFIIQSIYRCSNYSKTKKNQVNTMIQKDKIAQLQNIKRNNTNATTTTTTTLEITQEAFDNDQRLILKEHDQKIFWNWARRILLALFLCVDFLFHIIPLIYCMGFVDILDIYIRIIFLIAFLLIEASFFICVHFYCCIVKNNDASSSNYCFLFLSTLISMFSIANIIFVITAPSSTHKFKLIVYRIRSYVRFVCLFIYV